MFVGIDNYAAMVDDPIFWQALRNNLWFALAPFPVGRPGAGNGALGQRQDRRARLPAHGVLHAHRAADDRGGEHLALFHTPSYGLLEQIGNLFGLPSQNWLGDKRRLAPSPRWRSGRGWLLHDLLPRGAAGHQPEPARGRRHRGRQPLVLLPPRAVAAADADHDFVLVNAVINAFRMVDHVVVMTAAGRTTRPRCCSTTCTRSASSSGIRATRRPSPWCCWRAGHRRAVQFFVLDRGALLTMAEAPLSGTGTTGWSWLDTAGSVGLAIPVDRCRWPTRLDGVHPGRVFRPFSLTAPLTLENFAAPGKPRRSRAISSTPRCWCHDPRRALVLCTLAAYAFVRYEFRGKNVVFALVLVQLMIMPTSCWSRTTRR